MPRRRPGRLKLLPSRARLSGRPQALSRTLHTRPSFAFAILRQLVFINVCNTFIYFFPTHFCMISIVLVEPETPGNIGSIARVMKNFGLERLVLVNPKCSHLDGEAIGRAMHSVNILKKAIVVDDFSSIRKDFGTLVATTAALGTSTNVARLPLLPEQLAAKYSELRKGKT